MTKNELLVSVIIPVYNVEKYIEESVDSVLRQTYKNIEIILVDDGSKDTSGEICDQYIDKDVRIKVVHKENGGLSSARNAGMEVATGELYYFLDSDDYIEDTLIEKCVESIIAENADMIGFNFWNFNRQKSWKNKIIEEHILSNEEDILKVMTNHYLKYDFGFEVWSKMYRAEIIKDNNLKFEPNKEIFAEDICFNLYYFLYCKKIVIHNWYLLHYRLRDDSIMGENRKIVKVDQFTNLGKHVYNHAKKSDKKYFCKYFFNVLNMLLEIQLMHVSLRNRIQYITKDVFLQKMLYESRKHIIQSVKIMGWKRGIKYSLFASYYLKPNLGIEVLLCRVMGVYNGKK